MINQEVNYFFWFFSALSFLPLNMHLVNNLSPSFLVISVAFLLSSNIFVLYFSSPDK